MSFIPGYPASCLYDQKPRPCSQECQCSSVLFVQTPVQTPGSRMSFAELLSCYQHTVGQDVVYYLAVQKNTFGAMQAGRLVCRSCCPFAIHSSLLVATCAVGP